MKKKTTLLFLLTLFIVSALSLSTAFAQYEPYTQMSLPEGAKARFGTGSFGYISYFPNGVDTQFAISSSIGIWLCDAETLQVQDLLTGHNGPVYSESFSPDGSTLAMGLGNGIVELWDVATRTLLETHQAHTGTVWNVKFSPDGQTLATGGDNIPGVTKGDGIVHLWDVATGTLRMTLGQTGHIRSVSFSPDGQTLAAMLDNGTVELWGVATYTHRETLAVKPNRIKGISFSPDGQTLAGWDSWPISVHLWDVATGTLTKTLSETLPWYPGRIRSVSFSPDGQTLAVDTEYGSLLWDAPAGVLRKLLKEHSLAVNGVGFSPNSRTLVTRRSNVVYLWDADTGVLRKTLEGHTDPVFRMSFSSNGQTLATSGTNWGNENTDDTVRLWEASTGELLKTFKGHTGYIFDIRFSPDGSTLVVWSEDAVYLWDATTGTLRNTFTEQRGWHTYVVGFSPDGGALSHGNIVLLADVVTGACRETLEGGGSTLISSSPDGSILATRPYLDRYSNQVHLWDTATGTLRTTLTEPTGADWYRIVYSISFSPDGSIAATGSGLGFYIFIEPLSEISDPQAEAGRDDAVRLWNATTGEQKSTFKGHMDSVLSVSFSPNGQILASGGYDKTVRLWDVGTGALNATLTEHTEPVMNVSFSPDGQMLASGGYDKMVRLWDVGTGALNATLTEHTEPVMNVSFSPDGQMLASGDLAGQVHLWDVATGTLSSTLKGHVSEIYSINFNSDGSTLATRSADGTVFLWEMKSVGPPSQPTEDINGDGVINIQDLVMVASQFGQTGENKADVNGDGVVNIQDLVLVAAAFGDAPAAPTMYSYATEHLTPEIVQQWLATAKQLARTDATMQRGIAVLETLLAALTPEETALLPNYPNPFNPETWIPYQLAKPSGVIVSIYAADGKLVRTLKLGQQAAGVYASRSRAAYWDGRNEFGESVASGVYFYTLTAGSFSATRKMLIQK